MIISAIAHVAAVYQHHHFLTCQGKTLHIQLAGRVALEPQQSLALDINPEKIHLFDAQSGARLV
ncbi:hypothetical protein LJN55_00980 [Erwinia rhapontici]|uniref:hypothetical protein n=1 Tax=Erwinia rhapontici TaxID=55212 RepID=UPI001D0D8F86|nr:hypothetical protein [Erwinia rhapontici]UDQ80471.1 hypothetical protein LJN55_00980 [Erwinia rhapontici]